LLLASFVSFLDSGDVDKGMDIFIQKLNVLNKTSPDYLETLAASKKQGLIELDNNALKSQESAAFKSGKRRNIE